MSHRTLRVVRDAPSELPLVDRARAVAARGAGVLVLDVRDHRLFAAGHLAGSVNVAVGDPAFVDVCAGLLAPGVEIVVVGPAASADRAAALLRAGGLGSVVGRLADPGVASVSRRVGPACTAYGQVVDVRDGATAAPRGALRIPLADLLGRLGELRPDAPVAVLDDDGPRSSTAASLLRACGFVDVVEVLAAAPAARPRLRLLASA